MIRHSLFFALLAATPACVAPGGAADTGVAQDAIVGGHAAAIRDLPWQVSIQDKEFGHLCGGVILSDRYILTAHHCFDADPREPHAFASPHFYEVAAGISKLSRTDAEAEQRDVDDVIPLNDGYDRTNRPGGGDVALVRLAEPLRFGDKVQPIALATRADERAGRLGPGVTATVSGWGSAAEKGPLTDQLQALDLPVVPLEIATVADPQHRSFAADLIAAGGATAKDSCSGDSGGPLVVFKGNKKHHPLLAGVVSFGILDEGVGDCGAPGIPAIYNGVARYADLIEKYLCDERRVLLKKDHLAGKAKATQLFTVEVPAGQRELNVNLFGGTGDADVLVRRGAPPTATEHDCLSGVPDENRESCNLPAPAAGTWYVAVVGFGDYAGASLRINAYQP